MIKITKEQVVALWKMLPKYFGGRWAYKASSPVMQSAAIMLELSGVMPRDEFAKYTTTLNGVIYVNFTPGDSSVPLVQQAITCVHECRHLKEELDIGSKYWVRYATSGNSRAIYEARGYGEGLVLARLMGVPMDVEKLVDIIARYNVGESGKKIARRALNAIDRATKDPGFASSMKHQMTPAAIAARFLGVL